MGARPSYVILRPDRDTVRGVGSLLNFGSIVLSCRLMTAEMVQEMGPIFFATFGPLSVIRTAAPWT
jgi:hypothetical protein